MTDATPRTPGSQRTELTERPRRSLLYQVLEFVVMVAIAFGLAQVVRTYVIQPFVVPSGSMLPTIQLGDQVLTNKFVFLYEKPKPGDVVVLDDPTGMTPMLIKRVIAVGGQTIDIRDDSVWINENRLVEPYTHGKPTKLGTVNLPLTLPPDTVWVMGDNRPNSADSRYFGAQPMSSVHGRAFVVYWPPSRMGAGFDK